jgi:hypothetical protein
MGKTAQLNVNSSTYTAITAGSVCKRITIYEDDQALSLNWDGLRGRQWHSNPFIASHGSTRRTQ